MPGLKKKWGAPLLSDVISGEFSPTGDPMQGFMDSLPAGADDPQQSHIDKQRLYMDALKLLDAEKRPAGYRSPSQERISGSQRAVQEAKAADAARRAREAAKHKATKDAESSRQSLVAKERAAYEARQPMDVEQVGSMYRRPVAPPRARQTLRGLTAAEKESLGQANGAMTPDRAAAYVSTLGTQPKAAASTASAIAAAPPPVQDDSRFSAPGVINELQMAPPTLSAALGAGDRKSALKTLTPEQRSLIASSAGGISDASQPSGDNFSATHPGAYEIKPKGGYDNRPSTSARLMQASPDYQQYLDAARAQKAPMEAGVDPRDLPSLNPLHIARRASGRSDQEEKDYQSMLSINAGRTANDRDSQKNISRGLVQDRAQEQSLARSLRLRPEATLLSMLKDGGQGGNGFGMQQLFAMQKLGGNQLAQGVMDQNRLGMQDREGLRRHQETMAQFAAEGRRADRDIGLKEQVVGQNKEAADKETQRVEAERIAALDPASKVGEMRKTPEGQATIKEIEDFYTGDTWTDPWINDTADTFVEKAKKLFPDVDPEIIKAIAEQANRGKGNAWSFWVR